MIQQLHEECMWWQIQCLMKLQKLKNNRSKWHTAYYEYYVLSNFGSVFSFLSRAIRFIKTLFIMVSTHDVHAKSRASDRRIQTQLGFRGFYVAHVFLQRRICDFDVLDTNSVLQGTYRRLLTGPSFTGRFKTEYNENKVMSGQPVTSLPS